MHYQSDGTQVAARPAPGPVNGTPGYVSAGNVVTAQVPTIDDPDLMNAILDELCGIVLAAGAALDKTNNAQILAALRTLFNVKASYSGPNNGFINFPGGIYHETFTASVPCGGGIYQTNLTLPTAFPTNCLDATISFGGNSPPGAAGSISVQPLSRTQVAVTTNFQAPGPLGVVIKAFGV